MAATKICKVCGREYEACHNARRIEGVYRWQDVACCPEHGSIYLERVLAARASNVIENVTVPEEVVTNKVEEGTVDIAETESIAEDDVIDESVSSSWYDD